MPGRDTDFWKDAVWIADSTPVPCGASRPAVKRPEVAGWANYGYRASHSRWFWGLRLSLACTPAGLPVLWALADPKAGERDAILLITDKGFASPDLERSLRESGITLLRPSRKDEAPRPGEPVLKKSGSSSFVNDILKEPA